MTKEKAQKIPVVEGYVSPGKSRRSVNPCTQLSLAFLIIEAHSGELQDGVNQQPGTTIVKS
jgi:hypothetical protein